MHSRAVRGLGPKHRFWNTEEGDSFADCSSQRREEGRRKGREGKKREGMGKVVMGREDGEGEEKEGRDDGIKGGRKLTSG